MSGENALTGASHYHAQFGLPEKVLNSKGRLSAINGMLVLLYFLNGLSIRCHQASPEVWIVWSEDSDFTVLEKISMHLKISYEQDVRRLQLEL